MAGFLIAWNLWVYAVVVVGAIIFVVPTDLAFMLGPAWSWIAASRWATLLLTGGVMAAITAVAVRGLDIGKWLHNAGSVMILLAYVILLGLPRVGAAARHASRASSRCPWQWPKANWFSLAIFGQMTVGALSGFEYVAILAGECRGAARTIGQSVVHLGARHRRDVHPRHQHGAHLHRQPAHQRDRTHSADLSPRLRLRRRRRIRRPVRNLPAHGARRGQRQPDLHRPHPPAHGRRMGQPRAALVHPPRPAPPHAGEFHLLRRRRW